MSQLLNKPSFFVVNISDRNVCLSDLAITIPAGRCYDLLSDNFHYTIDQLKESLASGSLYKKRDKIKPARNRPVHLPPSTIEISKYPIIRRKRSAVQMDEPAFDDLVFSDEEYARMMVEDEED